MWRDWFIFSKRDSRAMLFLLVCLALVLAGRWLAGGGDAGSGAAVDTLCLQPSMPDAAPEADVRRPSRRVSAVLPRVEPSPFDPNTADSLLLLRQGIPPRVASNILKYRAAGGVFRSVQSLRKIYGMTDDCYSRIAPYVVLSSVRPEVEEAGVPRRAGAGKLPSGTVLDLNTADSALLCRVPGIGRWRASRIVRHRDRLGGYVSVSQLADIPGMPDSVQRWFRVDSAFCPVRIPVNTASASVLAAHPCISAAMARVITRHVQLHGPLKSAADLRLYSEFDSCDLGVLSRYLDFGVKK